MARINLANRPSIARINELFVYDPQTGVVRRLMAKGRQRVVNRLNVGIDKVHVELSHLVWALITGEWPTTIVDHKDGNRYNLKKENLRLASTEQNGYNTTKFGKVTANVQFKNDGYRTLPWFVRVRAEGKRHVFGGFATREIALEVAEQKKAELHGEFAAHLSRS